VSATYDFGWSCFRLGVRVLAFCWLVSMLWFAAAIAAPEVRKLVADRRLHRSMDRYQREIERQVWR
jgi:hypothetical protein